MGAKRLPKDLAKFLLYVLGRRPDEVGLVTNPDGFVKIKELLKAVNEEEGWGYVRRGHLDEVVITVSDASIEIEDDSIRAINQDSLARQSPAQNIPKNLFTCVRRKSYPSVLEKGILPGSFSMVILSSDKKMAERIGKRRDHAPVMLTINTRKTIDQGVFIYQAGETIFTTGAIPPDCFTGPSLPKQKAVTIKPGLKGDENLKKAAGSFMVELEDRNKKQKRRAGKKRKNEVEWKEDRKKMKKGKYKPWSA